MAKKAKLNDGIQDIDLTDTFIGQSFHDEISKSLSPSQTDFNNQWSDSDLSPSLLRSRPNVKVTTLSRTAQ